MNTSFTSQLNWRFATKKYDTDKIVDKKSLNTILEAIQYTPSSLGLQPYLVYIISDSAKKAELLPASFNQPMIIEASHVLVFVARTDVKNRIGQYIEYASGGDSEKAKKMDGFKDMAMGYIKDLNDDAALAWATKQVYIALGFGLAACAELGVDSTPMEGFEPLKVDKILNLPSTMKSVVIMTIGYRTEDPSRAKFRFPKDELFTSI